MLNSSSLNTRNEYVGEENFYNFAVSELKVFGVRGRVTLHRARVMIYIRSCISACHFSSSLELNANSLLRSPGLLELVEAYEMLVTSF